MNQLSKEEILNHLEDLVYLASLHERTLEIKLLTQISETIEASEIASIQELEFLTDYADYSSKLINSEEARDYHPRRNP